MGENLEGLDSVGGEKKKNQLPQPGPRLAAARRGEGEGSRARIHALDREEEGARGEAKGKKGRVEPTEGGGWGGVNETWRGLLPRGEAQKKRDRVEVFFGDWGSRGGKKRKRKKKRGKESKHAAYFLNQFPPSTPKRRA